MRRDTIVIGGSAGALQPLVSVLHGLPATFPVAVFVVIHTSPNTRGFLPSILARGAMSASYAADGDAIRPGHVFVAPPDRTLLIGNDRVQVTRGPRENGFRPAVDLVDAQDDLDI